MTEWERNVRGWREGSRQSGGGGGRMRRGREGSRQSGGRGEGGGRVERGQ